MPQLPIVQQFLLAIQGLALVALCFRLWRARLVRVYIWFFCFLVLELLQTLVPLILPLRTVAYRNAFVVTEALIVCFYALVVLELYSIILRDLAGLASTSRRYIRIALGVSFLLSLLPLAMEKAPSTVTAHLFTVERAVISSLAVFLLLIAGFLVYYPVPLHRNVIVYLAGYAVLFLTRNTALFIANLGYYFPQLFSTILMGITVSCLVFWIAALNPGGETKTLVIGHQWNPADEKRLLSQLEAINASLLRAARNS